MSDKLLNSVPSKEAVTVVTETVAAHGEGLWPKVVDWAAMAKNMPDYVARLAVSTGLSVQDLAQRGIEFVDRQFVSGAAVERLRAAHRDGKLDWGNPMR